MSALDSAGMSLIYIAGISHHLRHGYSVVRTIFVSVRLVGGACISQVSAMLLKL